MTAPSFNLDQEAAQKGSGGGGGMIDTGGPYVLQIKTAKHRTNDNGTEGIELSLEAQDGRTLRLTLWVKNSKGETIHGYSQLQALMTVLKLRSIAPQQGQVEEYDPNTQGMITVTRDVYPDLHQQVGMLLKREYYFNQRAAEHKVSMKLVAPFDPQTQQTAQEVLDQKQAEQMEKMIRYVRDDDPPASNGQGSDPGPESAGSDFEDIPF